MIMEKEIIFEKEKLLLAQSVINDIEFNISEDEYDFLKKKMLLSITGYIFSNMIEERILYYTFKRPTFFEWIFRKKRTATFNLKIKDLLLNAPKTNNTIRIYIVN